MAKKNRTPLTAVPQIPRIDGDDLYTWAQVMAKEQQHFQTKVALAEQYLQQRGYDPSVYLLSNDGYIVTQEQAKEAAERQGRIRTVPVPPRAESPTDPDQTLHSPAEGQS